MDHATFVELLSLEIATRDINFIDRVQEILATPAPKSSLDRQLIREDIKKLLKDYYWTVRNSTHKESSRKYLIQGMVEESGR